MGKSTHSSTHSERSALRDVSGYFAETLGLHGPTARGVDWNGEESQHIRFGQLSKVITRDGDFSVNDLGCGYGAYHDYLAARYTGFSYAGFDITPAMIQAASERLAGRDRVRLALADAPDSMADYGIASGIFNLRLSTPDTEWLRYIERTLDSLDRTSRLGFAFNCLTLYSDPPKMRPDLYYADPCALFDRCKRLYSRNVALLHDYGLYEFSILVRK